CTAGRSRAAPGWWRESTAGSRVPSAAASRPRSSNGSRRCSSERPRRTRWSACTTRPCRSAARGWTRPGSRTAKDSCGASRPLATCGWCCSATCTRRSRANSTASACAARRQPAASSSRTACTTRSRTSLPRTAASRWEPKAPCIRSSFTWRRVPVPRPDIAVRSAALLVLVLAASAAPAADSHPVTAWRLDGGSNRVYLLGSVHLLREEDHQLPEVIDEIYAEAEVLVMELDYDDVDPAAAQALIREKGTPEGERTLPELMGPQAWTRARALAAEVHIPLDGLARVEPWLAAITVEQLMLARIGFDPAFGIEHHLAQRAREDGKEVTGLETLDEQL